MQGELEIFREEIEWRNQCDEVVATGYEQRIFNITSSEAHVSGKLMICGDAGPLTGMTIKKFYADGVVWIDTCGTFHMGGRRIYIVCDA